MSLLRRYWNYLSTWRLHRATIKTLNKLTTRELNDIGIDRVAVNRLIWLDTDIKNRGDKL